MGGIKKIYLGDEISLSYGKRLPAAERDNGIYKVFGSNGVVGCHSSPCFQGPGIIIGRKGTVGSVEFSKEDFHAIDTTYVVSLDNPDDDIKFWYYFLQTVGLEKMNSHSAVPGLNREAVCKKVVFILEKIEDRKTVSALLSCLDNKIELNNRINKTLEEMAQAIFKSWFVDFEPLQDGEFVDSELGPIPKGWLVKSLDEIADFLNGLAMQKYRPALEEYLPVIKIKELSQGFTDNSSDKASTSIPENYIIKDGDVIFSWSGTLMVKIWTGGLGGLNQHLFKVTSRKYDKWYYYLWTRQHLSRFIAFAQDRATTMGHIKRGHLSEAKVLIPTDLLMEKLSRIMNPIYQQIIELNIQNRNLMEIRDTLLPKLMSGEIRVPIEEV